MGSGEGEIREICILGRSLRWTESGLEYTADRKYRRMLMEQHGLSEDSNPVVSPAVKAVGEPEEGDGEELGPEEARAFRASGATLNYLGQDRSDIQYAVKEVCVEMSRPTVGGQKKIKRIVRYLAGAEEVVWRFREWSDEEDVGIEVFVDSDWAKGADRKSTSGGMVVLGGVGIKHWSRTQKARALSSAEAEYYAIVSGTVEGLGVASLLEDLGWKVGIKVWTDSSAAKAAASRRGHGRMRHVELKYLWVQELVRSGRIVLDKVPGVRNVADHLTKGKGVSEVKGLLESVGAEMRMRSGSMWWRRDVEVQEVRLEKGW